MAASSCSLATTEDEAPDDAQQRRRSFGFLCNGGDAEEEGCWLLGRERELWRAGEGRCSSQTVAAAISCSAFCGSLLCCSSKEIDGWWKREEMERRKSIRRWEENGWDVSHVYCPLCARGWPFFLASFLFRKPYI